MSSDKKSESCCCIDSMCRANMDEDACRKAGGTMVKSCGDCRSMK